MRYQTESGNDLVLTDEGAVVLAGHVVIGEAPAPAAATAKEAASGRRVGGSSCDDDSVGAKAAAERPAGQAGRGVAEARAALSAEGGDDKCDDPKRGGDDLSAEEVRGSSRRERKGSARGRAPHRPALRSADLEDPSS